MQYPPGTIGVISTDLARYSWFAQSLMALALPPGTNVVPIWELGFWIPAAVNRVIRQMPPESQWVQVWADDHRFEPYVLHALLARNVDVVAPLCPLRRPPFEPSILQDSGPFSSQGYRLVPLEDLAQQSGLLEVGATGGPGMVIRRHVLEALGDPWFENKPGSREWPMDEIYICEKIRAAGFKVYVDLDTQIEHITSMAIRYRKDVQGRWHKTWWSYGASGDLLLTQGGPDEWAS